MSCCDKNEKCVKECSFSCALKKLFMMPIIILILVAGLFILKIRYMSLENKFANLSSEKERLCENYNKTQSSVSNIANSAYRSAQTIEFFIQQDGLKMNSETVTGLAESAQDLRHTADACIASCLILEDSAICKKK